MGYLYAGGTLIVDLDRGEIEGRELPKDLVASKLGGAALNLALFEEFKERDPVVFGTGPLTATMAPGSALAVATFRSPIDHRVMHVPLLSSLGAELKLSGFSFIVLHGKSEAPAHLWLHDEIADLLPADQLWGQDTWRTTDLIREEQGDGRIQVLSVGPAGERGGSIGQAVVNYWSEGDKVGLGARLGQMHLKALACRGMGGLEVADPERTLDLCIREIHRAKDELGRSKGISSLMPDSDLKNFGEVHHRDSACQGCPWPCRSFSKYNEPPTVLREALEEPGMMIADTPGFVSLLDRGFEAIGASRLMEAASRLGIEPISASALLPADLSGAIGRLGALSSTATNVGGVPQVKGATRPDIFSPFAPNGGEAKNIALAFILGICPRYAARIGMDLSLYSQMLMAGADIEMNEAKLDALASSIIR
jgi:aldehyde:ferredoxin oxidoreductase